MGAKRKRKCSVVLVILLLFGLIVPARAAEPRSESAADAYDIVTAVDEAGHVIRTLKRTEPMPISSVQERADLKTQLAAMGYSAEAIEDLDDAALAEYAAAPEIISVTVYYELDRKNGARVLREAQALQAAARSNGASQGRQNAAILKTTTLAAEIDEETMITYRLTFCAAWLTMPNGRRSDTIGITAEELALDPHSITGRLTARQTTPTAATVYSMPLDAQEKVPAWYSHAVVLPTDAYNAVGAKMVRYSDFRAYYSCKMALRRTDYNIFGVSSFYEHNSLAFLPLGIPYAAEGEGLFAGLPYRFRASESSFGLLRRSTALQTQLWIDRSGSSPKVTVNDAITLFPHPA